MINLSKALTSKEAQKLKPLNKFKLYTKSLTEYEQYRFIDGWVKNGGYIESKYNPNFGGDPYCCVWLYEDVIEVKGYTPEKWGASWWEKCRPEVLAGALDDEKEVWEKRHILKIKTLSEDLHNAFEAVRIFGAETKFPVYIENKTNRIFSWATSDKPTVHLSGAIPIGHYTTLSGSELVNSLKHELHSCQKDEFIPHRDFSLWSEYKKLMSEQ